MIPRWRSLLGRELRYDDRDKQAAGSRRGAKPREVYGFVGAISSIIGTVVYMMWAFLPNRWLHAVGFTYYPDRFWAVGIPTYLMVAVVLVCLVYTSLCYMATPPPDALFTLLDQHTRQAPQPACTEEEPIHPISDMPITNLNRLMFKRPASLTGDCENSARF